MASWTIRTGGDKWKVKAPTFFSAIKRAWRERPPVSLGMVVEGKPHGGEAVYCLSDTALRKAGFKCEKISLRDYLAQVKP